MTGASAPGKPFFPLMQVGLQHLCTLILDAAVRPRQRRRAPGSASSPTIRRVHSVGSGRPSTSRNATRTSPRLRRAFNRKLHRCPFAVDLLAAPNENGAAATQGVPPHLRRRRCQAPRGRRPHRGASRTPACARPRSGCIRNPSNETCPVRRHPCLSSGARFGTKLLRRECREVAWFGFGAAGDQQHNRDRQGNDGTEHSVRVHIRTAMRRWLRDDGPACRRSPVFRP